MITPKILNVGVYREAEKFVQITPCIFLGVHIKGLVRCTTYYPDGSLFDERDSKVKQIPPDLHLFPAGCRVDFEYGIDRENWVIMLEFPAICYDETTHQLVWNHDGNRLPIPTRIILTKAELAEMKNVFVELNELYYSSLPQNLLIAELLVLQIMQKFLCISQRNDDIVELFRKRLESDREWKYTISEHCNALGRNRDLLRKDFYTRYNISPGEYRIQQRLRRIQHLLGYSNMTLKEIAYEVGMKNLSHLSCFVRERCGKSPSELAREYRKNN